MRPIETGCLVGEDGLTELGLSSICRQRNCHVHHRLSSKTERIQSRSVSFLFRFTVLFITSPRVISTRLRRQSTVIIRALPFATVENPFTTSPFPYLIDWCLFRNNVDNRRC
eukprot:Pompholyxophrys_punicea_v1_NODE_91_length_3596_cov_9.787348.p2 type:complete len:112 gc:universal NODE_91_length_3596_cov_9.787348:1770-1435(-)